MTFVESEIGLMIQIVALASKLAEYFYFKFPRAAIFYFQAISVTGHNIYDYI